MRYIINTEDQEGIIGIQIDKWAKEKKLTIIEKADPVVEIEERLEKVYRALEHLKQAGYNSEVMRSFIRDKYNVGMNWIDKVLAGQEEFLRQIGALKK